MWRWICWIARWIAWWIGWITRWIHRWIGRWVGRWWITIRIGRWISIAWWKLSSAIRIIGIIGRVENASLVAMASIGI